MRKILYDCIPVVFMLVGLVLFINFYFTGCKNDKVDIQKNVITLQKGQKFVQFYYTGANGHIITRPMREEEKAEEYTIIDTGRNAYRIIREQK